MKNIVWGGIIYFVEFFIVLFLVVFIWSGAELYFEGASHLGKVDCYAAALIAYGLNHRLVLAETKYLKAINSNKRNGQS